MKDWLGFLSPVVIVVVRWPAACNKVGLHHYTGHTAHLSSAHNGLYEAMSLLSVISVTLSQQWSRLHGCWDPAKKQPCMQTFAATFPDIVQKQNV